ncbi:hypothetical protein ACIRPQ_29020 [Streptomyces sp. NPDC101213]|uniref:hypothetical protein n=1 Tax=Streptomyces sp. NPDC101213 TaxID=3366130 RepID=UPI00381BB001
MTRQRKALGPSPIPGWETLYDKPEHGAQFLRHESADTYALMCVRHEVAVVLKHFHEDRELLPAGGWCARCVAEQVV